MPARAPRKRAPTKRLALRRRRTPKQPRKLKRRQAAHAAPKAAAKRATKAPTPAAVAAKARRRAPPKPAPARPALPALGKLRIALFGAGGTIGSRIAAEATARGHVVTPLQRSPGFARLGPRRVGVRQADATDAASVASAVAGHDAVVSAINPPGDRPELLVRAARALVAGSRAAGVHRLVIVNGAGSLLVPGSDPQRGPDHVQLVDTADFPSQARPVALAHRDALTYLRDAASGVQWTAISPPPLITPGVRTGRYQIGTDRLLKGRDGRSHISAEDYAVAVVDELEKGRFKGKRMTVAWP